MPFSEMRDCILLFLIDEKCEHEVAEMALDVNEIFSFLVRVVQVSIVNLLSVLFQGLLDSFEQRLKVSLIQLFDDRIQRREKYLFVLQSGDDFGQVLLWILLDRFI